MIKEKDKLITTNRRKHSYNKDKTTKKRRKKIITGQIHIHTNL